MEGLNKGSKLPEYIGNWKRHVKSKQVSGTIVRSSMMKVNSASSFLDEHFLGLRVLWRYKSPREKRKIPPQTIRQFKTDSSLPTLDGWDQYLDEVAKYPRRSPELNKSVVPSGVGPFVSVSQFHKHVVTGDAKDFEEDADKSVISPSPIAVRSRPQKLQKRRPESPTPLGRIVSVTHLLFRLCLLSLSQ